MSQTNSASTTTILRKPKGKPKSKAKPAAKPKTRPRSRQTTFSGHEKFAIREGWLFKGLTLTKEDSNKWSDPHVADHLGIGRNMAKSLKYWLLATELCVPSEKGGNGSIKLSKFGKLILKQDKYFMDKSTWWLLHVNLMFSQYTTGTWRWFFNHFAFDRFGKSTVLELLKPYVRNVIKRTHSPTTLESDILCFLSTYSRDVPPGATDPEDSKPGPFSDLDFITRFPGSDRYTLNRGAKNIPVNIFGYAAARFSQEQLRALGADGLNEGDPFETSVAFEERSFIQLLGMQNSPGHVFCLPNEALYDQVQKYETGHSDAGISIGSLAGERTIRIVQRSPSDWLTRAYKST